MINVITRNTIDGKPGYIGSSEHWGNRGWVCDPQKYGVLCNPIYPTIQNENSELTNSDLNDDTISRMKKVYNE